jgi:hypothetical protein
MATLTAREKFEKPVAPQRKRLATVFAGIPAGSLLYISTPRELDERIRALPWGTVGTISGLRDELAHAKDADATCPVTTALYLRVVMEVALEQLAEGTPVDEITPFWRVVDPASAIAGRVPGSAELITSRRAAESVLPHP